MGKYDVLDKKYFAKPENMAELITVSVFRRKINVMAEELKALPVKYPSLRTKGGEFERDALYLCEKHHVKYGLEIEAYADYGMPRRIHSYDACEYEAEALKRKEGHEKGRNLKTFEEKKSGMKEGERTIPIVNIVLFLGTGRYSGCRSMREGFYMLPDEIKPYLQEKLNDYGFVLVEADYIDYEMFHGELRTFFKAMQARRDKQRLLSILKSEEFGNLSESTKQIIAIHLDQKYIITKVMEEKKDMCKALEDYGNDCKLEGMREGESKGESKGKQESIMIILGTKGAVTEKLRDRITNEEDNQVLCNYIVLASKVKSVEEFETAAEGF